MDNKYLNEVLERLESYRKKEQQIELLRYELQHAKQVRANRTDRSHDVPNPRRRRQPNGSIPKRRARHRSFLPAHRRTAERRSRRRADISRYTALCHERDRLLHYIGLLDKRQQDVVRKHYFEQQSWSEIAASMDLTPRTVQRTRQQALDELANLYAFADGILRR